jgi:hypothetical protein
MGREAVVAVTNGRLDDSTEPRPEGGEGLVGGLWHLGADLLQGV